MPNFTKQDLFNELATILLFEADHMVLSSGWDMAENFIGFKTDKGEYCFESLEKVDLRRFNAFGLFDRGFDYAFAPSLLNTIGESDVQDLEVFMLGTPKAGGSSSGGETHQFMTPDGFCQSVADAVHARWKLEWDSAGAGGHEFTPRELALLANMTEGAVRNAMSDKSEHGIRPIPGTKNPVKFSHDEAMRWLSNRRGFVAGPTAIEDDPIVLERLKKVETAIALGNLLKEVGPLSANQEELEALDFACWCDGTFPFDIGNATKISKLLGIETPLFVGKALEVSLRRTT